MSKSKAITQAKRKCTGNKFFIEFKNGMQKLAWGLFHQHDVLWLTGVAGTGKTYLATAFAINECLQHKRKIIITRPIVDAGEKLGFLPGDFQEKVDPYMAPIYDSINKLVGLEGVHREKVQSCLEIAPIAFLRGRTLDNAVCILDEAQNATMEQLILFLTRMGENSKMIITGDPTQSDIPNSGFTTIIDKLSGVQGLATIHFHSNEIVRHPMVAAILDKLNIK
jgi:phosphate starvation-inducible PhoH-like protein